MTRVERITALVEGIGTIEEMNEVVRLVERVADGTFVRINPYEEAARDRKARAIGLTVCHLACREVERTLRVRYDGGTAEQESDVYCGVVERLSRCHQPKRDKIARQSSQRSPSPQTWKLAIEYALKLRKGRERFTTTRRQA
jgi:hypothetical protein